MKYCKRCGNPVEPEDIFCGECGMPLSRMPEDGGVQEPSQPDSLDYQAYEPEEVPEMPEEIPEEPVKQDFELAEGEEIVRSYRCCAFEFPNQEGVLTVTTQRVIFYSSGEKTGIIRELPLAAAAGVRVLEGSCIAWGKALGGFAAVAAGLSILFAGIDTASSALLFLAGVVPGAVLMYMGLRPRFALEIASRWGAPLQVGLSGGDMMVRPGDEGTQMVRELGALIQDLQALGGDALEKWELAAKI